MKNHLSILYLFNNKCKIKVKMLTFNVKNCILEANAKTFCFETNKMAEWKRSFFKRYLSLFLRATPIHFCRSSFGLEAFSNGSNGKRRREECLKSKMAEEYNLNITMIVCQIEKWRKYIRCWSRSPINTLKFLHYNYLQLKLKLKQVKVKVKVKVRIMLMLMIVIMIIMIILKGEVI